MEAEDIIMAPRDGIAVGAEDTMAPRGGGITVGAEDITALGDGIAFGAEDIMASSIVTISRRRCKTNFRKHRKRGLN